MSGKEKPEGKERKGLKLQREIEKENSRMEKSKAAY